MSYVDSGLLTKSNTTPLLILSSGADVQYDPEPDYRLLTVSGKGKLRLATFRSSQEALA